MPELSQAERTVMGTAFQELWDGSLFGDQEQPARGMAEAIFRRAFIAGRDYGKGRERTLQDAVEQAEKLCVPGAPDRSYLAVRRILRNALAASQPEVLSERIEWWDEPERNARYYRHIGCAEGDQHWIVPLDDCPAPTRENHECVQCALIVPLVARDAQPDHGPGGPTSEDTRDANRGLREVLEGLIESPQAGPTASFYQREIRAALAAFPGKGASYGDREVGIVESLLLGNFGAHAQYSRVPWNSIARRVLDLAVALVGESNG